MTKTEPITTFERREIKYLLTSEQKQAFLQLAKDYLKPDENGDGGNYQLVSLYYDSPEKDFYWQKFSKYDERKKLRIRRYLGEAKKPSDEKVFIEIKEHTPSMNYKRRVMLSLDEAFSLLNEGRAPDAVNLADQAVIYEILLLVHEYHLEPSAFVTYQRQAYKAKKKHGGIRITFDNGIKYRVRDLNLDKNSREALLIEQGMEVMEIKVKEALPERLQNILSACHIEQKSFSKYARAIEQGFGASLVQPLSYERASLVKKTAISKLPLQLA